MLAQINPGTPGGVPASYDCSVRRHAYEFGKVTLPSRGEFKTLYDALQLHACGVTSPTSSKSPPSFLFLSLSLPPLNTHREDNSEEKLDDINPGRIPRLTPPLPSPATILA